MEVIDGIHAFIWNSMTANNCNTYLIDGSTRILIDPGHRHLFDHVRSGLADLGLNPEDIGLVLLVGRVDARNDLQIVPEAFRKQGPEGAVDEPAGENLPLSRSPLAPEEASRDLPGCIGFLLIIDRQGQEVHSLPRALGRHGRYQQHRVAIGDENRAVGLLRHPAGLKGQGPPPDIQTHSYHTHI